MFEGQLDWNKLCDIRRNKIYTPILIQQYEYETDRTLLLNNCHH